MYFRVAIDVLLSSTVLFAGAFANTEKVQKRARTFIRILPYAETLMNKLVAAPGKQRPTMLPVHDFREISWFPIEVEPIRKGPWRIISIVPAPVIAPPLRH
jgi:hypothetical protein